MDRQSALSSHAPLYFAHTPAVTQPEPTTQATARIFVRSNWELNQESAREEPRLRRLLGHISVYDRTKEFVKAQAEPAPVQHDSEQNELSAYLKQSVPSFEQFRAALRVQLETVAQIRLARAQCIEVDEYDSDEDGDDSDYDSLDGEDDWSEEDATDSEGSLTDNESDGQTSPCTSPMFISADAKYSKGETEEEDEEDVWAIRPLTPFLNTSNRVACAA